MDPPLASMTMKIEDRLRALAKKEYIDLGSDNKVPELVERLCDADAI
jgi:hypothetical protein